jgi:hypothetical protein
MLPGPKHTLGAVQRKKLGRQTYGFASHKLVTILSKQIVRPALTFFYYIRIKLSRILRIRPVSRPQISQAAGIFIGPVLNSAAEKNHLATVDRGELVSKIKQVIGDHRYITQDYSNVGIGRNRTKQTSAAKKRAKTTGHTGHV